MSAEWRLSTLVETFLPDFTHLGDWFHSLSINPHLEIVYHIPSTEQQLKQFSNIIYCKGDRHVQLGETFKLKMSLGRVNMCFDPLGRQYHGLCVCEGKHNSRSTTEKKIYLPLKLYLHKYIYIGLLGEKNIISASFFQLLIFFMASIWRSLCWNTSSLNVYVG